MTFTERPKDFIYSDERIVTTHYFRRRARRMERRLEREYANVHNAHFRVVKARRGPARWYVVKRVG